MARYHSLAAQRDTMPDCLTIIGEDAYGEVMAVKHRDFPVYGLQFHPRIHPHPGWKENDEKLFAITVTESLSLLVLARKQVKDLLARRDMSIKVERSYTICRFLYNKEDTQMIQEALNEVLNKKRFKL